MQPATTQHHDGDLHDWEPTRTMKGAERGGRSMSRHPRLQSLFELIQGIAVEYSEGRARTRPQCALSWNACNNKGHEGNSVGPNINQAHFNSITHGHKCKRDGLSQQAFKKTTGAHKQICKGSEYVPKIIMIFKWNLYTEKKKTKTFLFKTTITTKPLMSAANIHEFIYLLINLVNEEKQLL